MIITIIRRLVQLIKRERERGGEEEEEEEDRITRQRLA